MNKISQREARRTRRELEELRGREERQLSRWGSDFPGGVSILTWDLDGENAAVLRTAQILGHALVIRVDGYKARVYGIVP